MRQLKRRFLTTTLSTCSFLFILSSIVFGQQVLSFGYQQVSLNAVSGAGTHGAYYALPSNPASVITWQTSLSAAPAGSLTVILEGSFDGASFFTLDTTTNVNGEIRTLVTSVPFTRTTISAQSGGGNVTTTLIDKAQPYISSNSTLGSTSSITWASRSIFSSPADGVVQLTNNAGSGFTRLILGPSDGTTAGISLVNNGSGTLQIKTGDGSSAAQSMSVFTITTNTGGGIKTNAGTVSQLPTCNSGSEGNRQAVTDSTVTTFLTAVTGGGSNHVPVYCDATSWKVGG